jgi:hypothetical protein
VKREGKLLAFSGQGNQRLERSFYWYDLLYASFRFVVLLDKEGKLEGIGHKSCSLCETAGGEMNERSSGREGVQ